MNPPAYYPVHQPVQPTMNHHPRRYSTQWSVWLALLALFAVFLCTAASATVIIVSNDLPSWQWTVRPAVILAVLSSVTPILLGYVLSVGVTITWWRAAIEGASLEHLHQIWNRGFLLQPHKWKVMLFHHGGFTKVVISTILVTFAAFGYQPLLQQATKARNSDVFTGGMPMKIDLLQEIPIGLSGVRTNSVDTNVSASLDFTAAAVQWYTNETILTKNESGYSCDGTCYGIVRAPGISVDCSTSEETIDLKDKGSDGKYLFRLHFLLVEDEDGNPYVDFLSSYSPQVDPDTCVATVVTDRCRIYSAITDYKIIVQNDQVVVLPRTAAEWNSTDRTYSSGDLSKFSNGSPSGPLGGIIYVASTYFGSYTTSTWYGDTWGMGTLGIATEKFYIYTQGSCQFLWRSPTDDVLNGVGETLFRLSMRGNFMTTKYVATPQQQQFTVTRRVTELVYKSDYRWLTFALVVMIIAIGAAFAPMWGWWVLWRDVSLSPVETVQALPEDLMKIRDMDADEITTKYGNAYVKYSPNGRWSGD